MSTTGKQPKLAPFILSALLLTLALGWIFTPQSLILPLFFFALVFALAFPLLYFFRSQWRTTLVGRMMMTKSSAIATVFLVSVVRLLFPDWPYSPWIIAFAYAFLGTALAVQVFVLLREQRQDDDGEHRGSEVGSIPSR